MTPITWTLTQGFFASFIAKTPFSLLVLGMVITEAFPRGGNLQTSGKLLCFSCLLCQTRVHGPDSATLAPLN